MKKFFKRKFFIILYILITFSFINLANLNSQPKKDYTSIAKKIIEFAMHDSIIYNRFGYMCDTYGPRLSGSANLNKALEWVEKEMKKDGYENVRLEDVMVPHWVRGNEHCEMLEPRRVNMPVLAAGGSIATPSEGITAPVLVVHSFEELDKLGDKAKGKIVIYNKPFLGYGDAVQFRVHGASRAAKWGAVASIARPSSPMSMQNPHTGVMSYDDSLPKIPYASISSENCDLLDRMQQRGQNPILHLYMEDKTLPDTLSYNLMCEVKGKEKPDEILSIGGHSDSWDVGTGATDDAAGCFATWEALRIIKELGLNPKRTIRNVFFVNEENGTRGGKAYAEKHKNENHKLLFEFDSGLFPPSAISYNGPDSVAVSAFEPILDMVDSAIKVNKGGWGVDISPLAIQNKVPIMSLSTDDKGKYFWYHHSQTDTFDKINLDDFRKCAAAIAIAVYMYSELP